MSIFGDLGFPKEKQSPHPHLAALTLKVHTAIFDPTTNRVDLHAEAKIALSDGSARSDIVVVFFLNGNRLLDVTTDGFGLAVLRHSIDRTRLRLEPNELVVRVVNHAEEARTEFVPQNKQLQFTRVCHRWSRAIKWKIMSHNSFLNELSYGYGSGGTRFENLAVQAQAVAKGPPFALKPISVELRVLGSEGHWRTVATTALDEHGYCRFILEEFFNDLPGDLNSVVEGWDVTQTTNVWLLPMPSASPSMSYWREYEARPRTLPDSNNLLLHRVIVCAPGWPNSECEVSIHNGQGQLYSV